MIKPLVLHLNTAIAIVSIGLLACTMPATDTSLNQTQTLLVGNTETRVAKVKALLRHPPAMLDAHYAEQQYGDDRLGPADYQGFYYLQLPTNQIAAWVSTLSPLTHRPTYSSPQPNLNWWLAQPTFEALTFYEVADVTYRVQGWVGVNANTGQIFIVDFTT